MRLRGFGRTFQRGAVWWVAFYFHGVEHRESVPKTLGRPASTVTEQDARALLKARLSEIQAGRYVGPAQDRLTVAALLDSYLADLRLRGKKSIRPVESICRQLVATFGEHTRAADLTAERIAGAMQRWLVAKKARGTVAHRAARLQAALNLAHRQGQIARVPYIPPLELHNARRGFFEQAEFDQIYGFFREPVNDLVQFAYRSGWRRAEILGLTWADVDQVAGVVRLRDSKSGEGRVVPMYWTDDDDARYPLAFAGIIAKRWEARRGPWVFHRRGKPVQYFRDAWQAACKKAGVPGRIFHDFRRTAYRNMLAAGVDPLTAMTVCGHKTLSMAKRYAIHDVRQLGRALAKTEAHLAARRAADTDTSRTTGPEAVV